MLAKKQNSSIFSAHNLPSRVPETHPSHSLTTDWRTYGDRCADEPFLAPLPLLPLGLHFGKDGVITENDPEEQEKRLKYLDLVVSAVIFQNAVDISLAVQALSAEGYPIDSKALAKLSPYPTGQLKRYGYIVIDMETIPQPFEIAIDLPF